jgi:hypothetical protein
MEGQNTAANAGFQHGQVDNWHTQRPLAARSHWTQKRTSRKPVAELSRSRRSERERTVGAWSIASRPEQRSTEATTGSASRNQGASAASHTGTRRKFGQQTKFECQERIKTGGCERHGLDRCCLNKGIDFP